MSAVTLSKVTKTFADGTQVIHGIELTIQPGEFVVFVGPSGCGKSTLLRMIAGLEKISSGELKIGGKLANDLAPAQRGLAMVFQSYALYPHMSVFDNMAFSLELAGMKKPAITAAVMQAAEVLQITHLLQRKPKDLSGGQRQRVAIGRAIVRQPALFLFDEPLSNLDASLRVQMRLELSRLHHELKTTMIYVTHDQVEAMTLGERIVVFNAGKIEQVGSPLELYNHPANLFVAGFLGAPKMNFLPCSVVEMVDNTVTVKLGNGELCQVSASCASLAINDQVTLGIRAEHVRLSKDENAAMNQIAIQVALVEHLGDSAFVYGRLSGQQEMIVMKQAGDSLMYKAGESICLALPQACCHLFDAQGSSCIRH